MSDHHSKVLLDCQDSKALRNLGVFTAKARAIDEQALIRIRSRKPVATSQVESAAPEASGVDAAHISLSHVWTKTPFGPLACRTIAVSATPDDAVVSAKALVDSVRNVHGANSGGATETPVRFEAGSAMTASWPGFLPVEHGWKVHEYIPAQVFRRLEQQARQVAQESSGPLGLPPSLLDQPVIDISDKTAVITMRDVFALCAMGFIPETPGDKEQVRVSSLGRWYRIDGRFGSTYTLEGFSVLPLG